MNFIIRKNKHFSNRLIHKLSNLFFRSKRLSYIVTFNDNCLYNDETIDQYDVNKLFGFSNGLHYKNSARFGWNCIDDKINVYAYCYINGERKIRYIRTVLVNRSNKFTIVEFYDHYMFIVTSEDDLISQVRVDKTSNSFIKYRLWPYFGGNKKSPHRMDIEMIFN